MNGLQMMLKSFGIDIDPDEILGVAKKVGDGIENINASLARIETNQAEILRRLGSNPETPQITQQEISENGN